MYIIATEFNGEKAGYAANTAFQVTAEPSTIAISCNKNNRTAQFIALKKAFSISVLQKELNPGIIGDFGFKSGVDFDKFKDYSFQDGITGVPIVTDQCIAGFECKVINEVDCGTHILFIGEVVDGEIFNDNAPLTYDYYHTHYKMRSPKNAPTYIDPNKLQKAVEEVKRGIVEAPNYVCTICGYVYEQEQGDPDNNVPPGTPFEDLPDDYECPLCRALKDYFTAV